MRPYNNYRNSELSQQVSSVENTLTEMTSNSNIPLDILRSLSESISVDCGSFEISAPTEYYQPQSVPSHVAFVAPSGKEIRTPVENPSAAPVNKEPSRMTQPYERSSVNTTPDKDDDNYDCMNDPNYRAQCQKNSDAPSFEELMARTAEGIAKMREETRAAISIPEASKEKREAANNERNCNTVRSEAKSDAKPAETEPSTKTSFLSNSWNKTRKLLFSRETIKLTFLSIAISALIVSAVIYKSSQNRKNGLPESEDVVINQQSPEMQDVSVQGNEISDNQNGFKNSDNGNYWGQPDDNSWNNPAISNRQAMTDSFQDDYQSPAYDVNQIEGYEYSQNEPDNYLNQEDAGRLLTSPHSSNTGDQFVDAIPSYNVEPKYAEIAPAIGSGYIPNEYESPVLEDDTVREYSETGYNSNFMR